MQVSAIQHMRQSIDNGYAAFALRLVTGGIFIFSGITKVVGYGQFIDTMGSYAALPQPVILASVFFIPWLELIVGVYLLLGLFLRWTALAAGILSLCFIAVNAVALYYGSTDCPNCFGPAIRLLSSQALAIDIFLLLAAVYLFFNRQQFLSLDEYLSRRKSG